MAVMQKMAPDRTFVAAAVLAALVFWVVDAAVDALMFRESTLADSLLGRVGAHELYFRLLFVVGFVLFGLATAAFLRRQRRTEAELRKAVEAFEDERTKSAAVLDAIADGISIQDRQYRILYQNRAHKAMVGDQVGRLCYEAYASGETICTGCPVEQAFRDGGTHVLEKAGIGRDGRLNIEINASPLRNSAGEIVAGIEAVRDISERSLLRRSLEQQKRFAEAVIQHSAVAMFVLGPDHRVVLWNRACEELTGVPAGWVVGTSDHWKPFYRECRQTLADVVIDGDVSGLAGLYDAHAESLLVPGGLHAEGWYEQLNGRRRYIIFDAIPVRTSDGALSVVIETLQDITDRKQTEDKLRLFSQAIAVTMDGVQMVGLDGQILYSNESIEEIYGYPPYELLGKHVRELNADPGFADRVILPALTASGRWSGELAVRHRTGREVPIWLTATTVTDDDGKPLAMVGIIRDMTRRKQMEGELRSHQEQLELLVRERTKELVAAKERLEREIVERRHMEEELLRIQKLESLGLLAGGIAHDFNNLLSSILGNITLTMLDLPQQGHPYQQLATAERAALQARDLTQQLLTFARGGAPVKSYTSMEQLVRETAEFSIRGSRARLEFRFADGLWPIEADQAQMGQVINNLVINADQAMPEGGVIELSGENAELGAAEAAPLPAGNYIRLAVRDSGIGIPKEYLTKIFDPYFTTKQKGTGLGLAVTYSIIQRHGGHIAVDSEPGKGTCFRITLPAADERRTLPRPPEPRLFTGTGRILVMDDEADVRTTTGDVLARLGYTVDLAEDGAQALERYRRAKERGEPYDLTIMDLTVPGGMGGREAAEQLLAMDPSARVIVSSGYAKDPVMADYARYGFRGVVMKPYRVQELSEVIHQVLRAG